MALIAPLRRQLVTHGLTGRRGRYPDDMLELFEGQMAEPQAGPRRCLSTRWNVSQPLDEDAASW